MMIKTHLFNAKNKWRPVPVIFTEIYEKKYWGNSESVSGTGSTLAQTQQIIKDLPVLFDKYKISSILDAPCGDFNWMQHIDLNGKTYMGADVVRDLIIQNKRKFPNVLFEPLDILESQLPCMDLILCRDCLVHFSEEHVKQAISNMKRSKSKFLLTTTFPNNINVNIVTGNWRPINLQEKPFSFPLPIELLNEGNKESNNQYNHKSLGLWRLDDITI